MKLCIFIDNNNNCIKIKDELPQCKILNLPLLGIYRILTGTNLAGKSYEPICKSSLSNLGIPSSIR